jgi:hypothetical protein
MHTNHWAYGNMCVHYFLFPATFLMKQFDQITVTEIKMTEKLISPFYS